jgi:uracil-DNA glycosylase
MNLRVVHMPEGSAIIELMPTTSITAVSVLQFLPAKISINPLREAARSCQGCPLFKDATQTVFGEGRRSARALLVGEQPGHDEDLQGQPFVGPAGRVLDEGLEAAGISRAETYVTNVVKHFKWIPKGSAESTRSRAQETLRHASRGSKKKLTSSNRKCLSVWEPRQLRHSWAATSR